MEKLRGHRTVVIDVRRRDEAEQGDGRARSHPLGEKARGFAQRRSKPLSKQNDEVLDWITRSEDRVTGDFRRKLARNFSNSCMNE